MYDKIYIHAFWSIFNRSFQKQIIRRYDLASARITMKHAKENFHSIMINTIPLVGKHNPKMIDILFTGFVASIYKAGKGKISLEQMYPIMTESMESVSFFRISFKKDNHFSKKWQTKRNLQAICSRKEKYAGDFVSDFVYGNTFDEYGINYYECAIYKLLIQEKCPELTPLFCRYDYFMAEHMNATLKRTKTLANDDNCCNFWYTKVK
jgi:hypothetical protein